MKNALAVLVLGALAAALSFLAVSQLRTPTPTPHAHPSTPTTTPDSPPTHHTHAASHPVSDANASADLAWVAREFQLDPAAFERVRTLHARYKPTCADLCRRIDEHNRRLAAALTATNQLSDETRRLIEEGARVRADCHTALAAHLLEVANCMPPDQGRRYLQLMLPATGITASSHPIGDFSHAQPPQ